MRKAIIITFATFITLVSCRKEIKKEIETTELIPSKIISQIDSLLFINVSLNSAAGRNFILSQYPSFLASTDNDFKLLWIHDKEGQGPSDLSYPEQSIIRNGNIFVLDHGNQSVKQFDIISGTFKSSLRIPEPVMKFRFDKSDSHDFFFSVFDPIENYSAIKVNSEGKLIMHYGALFPETGIGSNRQMKYFQLDDKENIILIGASLPYIEILNKDGKSLNRFSIDQYEPIKRAFDSLENDIKFNKRGLQPNSIPSFIVAAQFTDGKLYISFTDRIGLDRSKARNLLVFKLDEESCELERIYKFKTGTQDDGFHPINFFIDAKNKKLLIQGLITKQIYEFKLPV